MTDDPFKAPDTSVHADPVKPPRVVVFALLGIILIASAISIGNYRRNQLRRRAAVQRLNAQRAAEAAQELRRAKIQDVADSLSSQ